MKTTAIALATILALSSAAFAGVESPRADQQTQPVAAQSVDGQTTGSISHGITVPAGDYGSKLGGDIDPSVLPNF